MTVREIRVEQPHRRRAAERDQRDGGITEGDERERARPTDRQNRGDGRSDAEQRCGVDNRRDDAPRAREADQRRIFFRLHDRAAIAFDRPGELVLPGGLMTNERRLLAHDARDAAIALRKEAAEFVDGGFGVDAELKGVGAHVGARVDAGRPARKIVPLQPRPEVVAHFRGGGNLIERDAALNPNSPKIGTESFPFAHARDLGNRKNLSKLWGYRTSEELRVGGTDEAPLHGSTSHFSTTGYGFGVSR